MSRSLHPPAFFDRLLGFYDQRRKAGAPHSVAIKDTLAVVLASPRFIYLTEQSSEPAGRACSPATNSPRACPISCGDRRRIAPCGTLAARGELLKPEVLTEQTDRLIDDSRSAGFITPFVHQWLGHGSARLFPVQQRALS